MIRCLCALIFMCLSASSALAHSASRSFSTWDEDGKTVHMRFIIDQVQATLLIPLSERQTDLQSLLAGHLAASVYVDQNGITCPAALPQALPAANGALQVRIDFSCPKPVKTSGWRVRNAAFFDLASTHIHIAQIDQDALGREFIFTSAHRAHVMRNTATGTDTVPTKNGFWTNFTTYIQLGITHILRGFDHLAFVTALIILARTYKGVALLVTGFTLGHSVTLSLAALGVITPNGPAIEALIGFSIAFVAMENLLPPNGKDWRRATLIMAALFAVLTAAAALGVGALSSLVWGGLALFVFSYGRWVDTEQRARRAALALTTAFGLVHGAGFASVLGEAGLPDGRQIAALGGFNIGVEIGQLAVIALWLIAFALLKRLGSVSLTQKAQIYLSAVIFTLGIFWFTSRALI